MLRWFPAVDSHRQMQEQRVRQCHLCPVMIPYLKITDNSESSMDYYNKLHNLIEKFGFWQIVTASWLRHRSVSKSHKFLRKNHSC